MDFKHAIVLWLHIIRHLLTTNSSELSSPKYLGCFVNEDLNSTVGLNVPITSMTPEACAYECLAQNYTYAAYNESLCRCTNNYMSKLMKETDDDCNASCGTAAENESEKCQTRFKMFKTQNTSEETYPQAIYLGCYGEKMGDDKNRLLKFPHMRFPDNTPQKCSEECFELGFLYSGSTNGEQIGTACWCGNQYPSTKFKINDSKCNNPCPGDQTKYCGGVWRMSIYSTGIVDYPLGDSIGCFNLDKFSQSYKKINTLKDNRESQRCFFICNERRYKYSSVSEEYCECSYEKPTIDQQKKPEECNKCEGDESEYCGSPSSVSVYENNDWPGVGGDLLQNHLGCFENSWMYPVMEGWNISFPQGLTSRDCVSSCYAKGYPYAALVSSTDCLCSFVSPPLEAKVEPNRGCEATCSGRAERACGDGAHYNVFATGVRTSRVAGDRFLGCYEETNTNTGDNSGTSTTAYFPSANSPRVCAKHCDRAGFRYFGLVYRETCWCGHVRPAESLRKRDALCSLQCSGNANKYCGGVSTMAVFRVGIVTDIIHNCPPDCECYFTPKYNVTTINCSKRNLNTSPTILPIFWNFSSHIELILSDNLIDVQPNLTSLSITSLNISNNSLSTLDVNLLPKSLKVLYIDNNRLTTMNDNLFRLIQSLDSITLSKNLWSCECHMKTSLLKFKLKIKDLNDITCTSSTQPVIQISEYELCKMWKIDFFYISIVLAFILFFCVLSVYFNLHKLAWAYVCNIQFKYCYYFNTIGQARNGKNSSETFMQRIQVDELIMATDNWNASRILGEGGFGVVYKGNWRHTDVAIKRLKASGVAERVVNMHTLGDELVNPSKEIMYLNAVKHDNVLSMYGFCFHPTGSCLIYQYMANGSLEDRLQRKNGTEPLSWSTRGHIAVGSAKGLQFLHNLDTPLIHGDIKSANILLDSNFEPRIGDFGLARTGPLAEINKAVGFDVSRVYGTKPYLPADFLRNKKLSTKVDTYSFGVVMFEIATGLKAFNRYKNYKYLTQFVINYDSSLLCDIADKTAGHDSLNVFETLVSLGKLCVTESAENRPEMVVIYMNLQNFVKSSNVTGQRSSAVLDKQYTSESDEQLLQFKEPETQTISNVDLIKLNGRKAALRAPLFEIPSISEFYSDDEHDLDPRKIITAELKSTSTEIMDEGFFTTDF